MITFAAESLEVILLQLLIYTHSWANLLINIVRILWTSQLDTTLCVRTHLKTTHHIVVCTAG